MALIEVSEAGGASNENGAYVGGVQPGNGDDLLIPATAGAFRIPTGITLLCRSLEVAEAWAHEIVTEGTGRVTIGGATSKADNVACRIPFGKTNNFNATFSSSSGASEKIFYAGNSLQVSKLEFKSTGTTYLVEENMRTGSTGEVRLVSGALTVNAGQEWGAFNTSGSVARTLNIENQTIKLLNTGIVWTASIITNLTLKVTGSTIQIVDATATGKSFVPGAELVYYNLKLPGGAANPKIKITQNCAFNNLEFTEGQKVLLEPTKAITIKVNRVVGAKGTSAEKITIESATAGSAFTLEGRILVSDLIFDFVTFKDVHADSFNKWYAGSHSTNVSGNENLKFEAAPAHEHTLTVAQASSPTKGAAAARSFTSATTQAISRARALARSLAGFQSQTPGRAVALSRALAVAQAQQAGRAVVLARAIAAAQSQSFALSRGVARALAAAQAQAQSSQAAPARLLALAQAQSPSRAVALARALAVTQAQQASEMAGHVLSGAFTASQGQGAVAARSPGRRLAATAVASPLLAVSPSRTISCSAAPVAALGRSPLVRLATTQASSPTATRAIAASPSSASSSGGVLARSPARVLALVQSSTSSTARDLSATLICSGGQAASLEDEAAEPAPFIPGKLTSSTVAARMTSTVEGHDSSSVAVNPLVESSVD